MITFKTFGHPSFSQKKPTTKTIAIIMGSNMNIVLFDIIPRQTSQKLRTRTLKKNELH